MYSHSPAVTMNAIRLLLVSTILFYNEINGPLTGSASSSTRNLSNCTVLKPYMSKYDEMFKVSSDGTCKYNSRNVLTATLKKTLSAQFTPERWAAINTKNYSNIKNIDDSTSSYKNTYRVYYNFLGFISLRLGEWLQLQESNKEEIVGYYFGFETDAVNLINNSLTAILAQERKQNVCMKHPVSFFFYLLDLDHVVPHCVQDRGQKISKKLKDFYDVSKDTVNSQVGNKRESEIKNDWSSSLQLDDDKRLASPSFGVTLPGMKLWLLIEPPTDDNSPLKYIQNLKPNASDQKTLSDYVRSYAHEFDVYKVNDYHVSILSVLITHLFRYVHNHFTLLLKLEEYKLEEGDTIIINEFKKFMNGYVSLFIDRYFEFKGEISQEIVDAMFPIMFFLDPSNPQYVDSNDFTENEKKFLKEHKKPKMSISDYYEQSLNKTELEPEMRTLIGNAVDVLIKSFTDENDSSKTVTAWNKELESKFRSKRQDRPYWLKLIDNNNTEALSLLDEFSRIFTV